MVRRDGWGSRGRFSEFLRTIPSSFCELLCCSILQPLDSHGLKCLKICGHPDPHLWTPRHRWTRTFSYQRMRWVNLRTFKTMRRMSHRGPWARFKRVWETQWEVRGVMSSRVACLLLCFNSNGFFMTKLIYEIDGNWWSKMIKLYQGLLFDGCIHFFGGQLMALYSEWRLRSTEDATQLWVRKVGWRRTIYVQWAYLRLYTPRAKSYSTSHSFQAWPGWHWWKCRGDTVQGRVSGALVWRKRPTPQVLQNSNM